MRTCSLTSSCSAVLAGLTLDGHSAPQILLQPALRVLQFQLLSAEGKTVRPLLVRNKTAINK